MEVRQKFSLGGKLTPVVKTLIIINSAVFLFLLVARDPDTVVYYLGLVPALVVKDRAFWQPFTYMFVHTGFWHILFNMLGLWWFGCDVERGFGSGRFLRYYLFTGVGAGLCVLFFDLGQQIPTIGASGAIFGVLLAYAILFPNRVIYLYFVIPVKAKWAVLGFAVLEFTALLGTDNSGISHIAHVGGVLFGLLWFGYKLKIWRAELFRKIFRRRVSGRLVVVGKKDGRGDDYPGGKGSETVH